MLGPLIVVNVSSAFVPNVGPPSRLSTVFNLIYVLATSSNGPLWGESPGRPTPIRITKVSAKLSKLQQLTFPALCMEHCNRHHVTGPTILPHNHVATSILKLMVKTHSPHFTPHCPLRYRYFHHASHLGYPSSVGLKLRSRRRFFDFEVQVQNLYCQIFYRRFRRWPQYPQSF